MKQFMKLLLVTLVAALAAAGCGKEESKKEAPSTAQPAKKESVVVVPDSVKGKWKAVKIAVIDKATGKQAVYTVNIGSQLTLPDSKLTLKVLNFLPHFVIEGSLLTSQSNAPKNPAAQIVITEGGREVFKGWLFALFPTTHAFQHPQYGFTLVDFVPAQ